MSLYERIADLPVTIDGYRLERRERETSSDFTRVTTVFTLEGDGARGRGEDVTYDADEHEALLSADLDLPLAGEYTLAEFSAHLDGLDLFPSPPEREVFRNYRRWAVESAALDLALRQAGRSLGEVLDRQYDPVRFVVSTRLGDPPRIDRIEKLLAVDSDLEFKLDPTSEWTRDLAERVAARAPVRILDLKGQYEGTNVDQPVDPDLYELVLETFPAAVVEDPALTPETQSLFAGHEDRISWDYPITGVESVADLSFEPSWLNVKPSRFGTIESLFETIEYARERGIDLYGGGQFELDVGRQHLHVLASLFYPDAPNDVAPGGYNDPEPRSDLPSSPLAPPEEPQGLGWT
jgi:hypothetical protein